MTAFRPLLRELSLWFHKWALREICPMHRDVPHIVLTIHRLERERNA